MFNILKKKQPPIRKFQAGDLVYHKLNREQRLLVIEEYFDSYHGIFRGYRVRSQNFKVFEFREEELIKAQ